MNQALVANLSNSELANLAQGDQDISRIVVNELVLRFIALVDDDVIKDPDDDVDYDDRDNEIDELRSTIAEAIAVLESI